jgi:hypothetical protein
MEEQNYFSVFDEYEEPKQAEKDELIDKLQSGKFSLSYSSLAAFSVSPRAFVAYKIKERDRTTKAMLLMGQWTTSSEVKQHFTGRRAAIEKHAV